MPVHAIGISIASADVAATGSIMAVSVAEVSVASAMSSLVAGGDGFVTTLFAGVAPRRLEIQTGQ